jgi:hypothetical protein
VVAASVSGGDFEETQGGCSSASKGILASQLPDELN